MTSPNHARQTIENMVVKIEKDIVLPPPTTWIQWKPLITRSGPLSPEMAREFEAFVKAHPEKMRGYKTTLHWICSRNPPVSLAKQVLYADPEALLRKEPFVIGQTNQRVTPLGIACRTGASLSIIRMLIRSRVILHARQQEQQELRDQQGLKRKRRYVAPIVPFYPFQTTGFEEPTFNPEHLRVLLEEFPQGATMSHAPDGTTMLETVLRINEKESDAYWENVNMVLKAAAYGTIKESELQSRGPFLLLHTFLELVCCVGPFQGWARDYSINFALDFIDWINDRQPIQFQRRDSDGNFPLHIAMQNTSMGRDYTSQLWTYLVEQCPESAGFADSEGRLALHQAITRRLDCIDILIEAEPRAVTTRDIATHMYPFEQVAYRLVAAQAPAPPAAPAGFMAQLSQEVEVEPAAAPPAVPAGFMAQQAVFQPQEVEVEPAAGPPAVPAGFMAQLFAQPGFRPRVVRPQANVSNPEDENTEALDLMYKLLRMAPHVARNSIRETYVDTPEYLEFQRNKLEMAQIELESYTKRKAIEKRNKELQRRFKLL